MNIGRESETVEFKKSTAEKDAGLISIASILNKHRQGFLFFGVKDTGDVCGMDIGKETLRSLSRDIANHIRPLIWYEINAKTSDDGRSFIEVHFAGENRPYCAFGKYYERFADEDRMISDSELERLFLERRKDYSAWEISDSFIPSDFCDEELLKNEINNGIESKRINYHYVDAISALKKFGLIHSSGNLNNAGNVLFSKEKPILVKLATFATETKETFTKLNLFNGNLFECYRECVSFILNSIGWDVSFDGGMKRTETPEIPLIAIREIVMNAFLHGCYNSNTAFEIDVFRNRVSVYSPGFFPDGFEPADFLNGSQQPIQHNPKIAEVLFGTGEIESFGTGFEKTYRECEKYDINLSYEKTKTGFRFTMNRPHEKEKLMTKTQLEILEIIRNNSDVTAVIIANQIGKTTKTVYRALSYLKRGGYIKRVGDDSNGYWEVE